ncbi:MAG TPA: DUF3105 domain-containing protein [Chloroflexota bacterium]|nr:DUF3105 domain-containing protein [Chloroflexota bacterium]
MSQARAQTPPTDGLDRAARRELRRQKRLAAQETKGRLVARQRQRRRLLWGGVLLLALLGLGALIYWLVTPDQGVQSFPIQGRMHINRGAPHPPYNSKPPTSGWHYADAVAPPGVSEQPIPDEVQVHNLEHGEVMIQYDCPGGRSGCPEMVAQLEAIVRTYPKKVILAPYPGIGQPIALTAWGKLAYLKEVDEAFIRDFIARYKDKGPEFFPD